MTAADPDADLLPAARAGDRDALDALLRRHEQQLHALCRRVTGDPTDAVDALQEAMIAIVRGLPRFDGRSKVSTWMHRVATNACLDELRRRGRRPADALPEQEAPDPAGPPGVADGVADRTDLDAALASLAPEFRAPVVLRDVLGHDYAEIATLLDLPPGTVRSRIARGRAHLARALGAAAAADPGSPTAGNQTPAPDRPSLQP
ncbi:MAG TPA: sigma-70 family RNA polymerase sigma factor [Acidimicrobiales bacterium]|nr:sigma-70 family RNA polymerase sigma factor [Acidimicrobiales bacterium]